MSRWGKNRNVPSYALPLDALLKEKENTNRPVAARSAGTVGKWGMTSFTSIRARPVYGKQKTASKLNWNAHFYRFPYQLIVINSIANEIRLIGKSCVQINHFDSISNAPFLCIYHSQDSHRSVQIKIHRCNIRNFHRNRWSMAVAIAWMPSPHKHRQTVTVRQWQSQKNSSKVVILCLMPMHSLPHYPIRKWWAVRRPQEWWLLRQTLPISIQIRWHSSNSIISNSNNRLHIRKRQSERNAPNRAKHRRSKKQRRRPRLRNLRKRKNYQSPRKHQNQRNCHDRRSQRRRQKSQRKKQKSRNPWLNHQNQREFYHEHVKW